MKEKGKPGGKEGKWGGNKEKESEREENRKGKGKRKVEKWEGGEGNQVYTPLFLS